MVPMELVGVRLEVPANAPVMMLREQVAPQRVLPIYIGGPEASAIHYALEGIVPPRPLTHDLLVTVMGELGGVLERVVVTDMRDHTFFAELHIRVDERLVTISCRPSDAVAISVRLGTPIFAAEPVLDEAGQVPETEDEEEAEEILDEFRDFIEHVNPEDFAG